MILSHFINFHQFSSYFIFNFALTYDTKISQGTDSNAMGSIGVSRVESPALRKPPGKDGFSRQRPLTSSDVTPRREEYGGDALDLCRSLVIVHGKLLTYQRFGPGMIEGYRG